MCLYYNFENFKPEYSRNYKYCLGWENIPSGHYRVLRSRILSSNLIIQKEIIIRFLFLIMQLMIKNVIKMSF